MQDMTTPTRPLRPQSIRSQRSQPHQSTQGSGTWRVLGGFLAGVMTAAVTLWIALGTPIQHQLAALTKQNTALTRANTALHQHIDVAKEAVHTVEGSRKELEAQNILLSQKDRQYEATKQELVVQLLLTRMYLVVEQLKGNVVIPVGIRSSDTTTVQSVFTINHKMENGFNEKSWHAIIAHVKEQLRAYNKQAKGVKYETTVMNQLNLKAAINLALGDMSEWGETEKAFVQELRERIHEYIQHNPEGFDTPLHFVFTGVEMKVTEANKEHQRVAGLYEASDMGEQHFASRIQATVAQLFLHVWPSTDPVLPSLRLNGYDEWYVRHRPIPDGSQAQ
jgi:hypothetical protein